MIITVCNFKGGVGKTTTCHALSVAKGLQEKKVLMVDLDSQHSLTTSCGIDISDVANEDNLTLMDLIQAECDGMKYNVEDIKQTIIHLDNVDIIPSTDALALSDRELIMLKRLDGLKAILDKIKSEYDYIFMDCSPSRNMLCENALISSDSIIIPVESYFLGSEGLYDFLNLFKKIKKEYNHSLYIEGILLTMYQGNTTVCQTMKSHIMESLSDNTNVFKETIPRSIKVSEATIYGKSIIEYAPENPVSKAYIEVAKQINDRKLVNV